MVFYGKRSRYSPLACWYAVFCYAFADSTQIGCSLYLPPNTTYGDMVKEVPFLLRKLLISRRVFIRLENKL